MFRILQQTKCPVILLAMLGTGAQRFVGFNLRSTWFEACFCIVADVGTAVRLDRSWEGCQAGGPSFDIALHRQASSAAPLLCRDYDAPALLQLPHL